MSSAFSEWCNNSCMVVSTGQSVCLKVNIGRAVSRNCKRPLPHPAAGGWATRRRQRPRPRAPPSSRTRARPRMRWGEGGMRWRWFPSYLATFISQVTVEIRKTKRDDTLNKKRNVPLTEVSQSGLWKHLPDHDCRIQQMMRMVGSPLQQPLWRRLSSEPKAQNLPHS